LVAALVLNLLSRFFCQIVSMAYIGKVSKGAVKLPPGVDLPDGTAVELILPEPAKPATVSSEKAFILHETALAFPTARDLPDDLATNHDYYLHGGNKQQPRLGRWISVSQPTPELTRRQAAEFTDKLLEFAAETSNLPPDLSANHDHYLHGLPKQ
jgi:hypothetical protein